MFELNTNESKKQRIMDIERLNQVVSSVAGNQLSFSDSALIRQYLNSVKFDLEKQLRKDGK